MLSKTFLLSSNDFWEDARNWFTTNLPQILISVIIIAIIIVLIIVLERVSTRLIKRFGKRHKLTDDVTSGLALMTRLFIILIGLAAIAGVGGIPSEWIVSISAVLGAAIGFASSKTIGNIIAGLYVLITRPFRIGEYVRVQDTEGIIQEITINYTKVRTSDNRTVLVSNQDLLDARIVSFSTKDISKSYCLTVGFDHSLTDQQYEEIFNKVISKFTESEAKNITYSVAAISRLEREYTFYFVLKKVDDYLSVPAEFQQALLKEWEQYKLDHHSPHAKV